MAESAVFISSSSRDRVDHDVFISYSRRDSEFARHLLTRLKGENRDAWVDWQAIEAAEDFWQAIEVGIEAANTFVFILSPDSVASKYCNQEIDHAVKHNKRLIPAVCRNVDADVVHAALRPLNWIFFPEANDDAAFAQLVRAIDTDLPYVRMHTRLQVKAIEWNKRGRDDSFLLRKMDLADAETWLASSNGKEPTPTALQQEYITTSRTVEDEYNQLLARGEQARQRVKWAAISTAIAVITAVGAGAFALAAINKTNYETQIAATATKNAQDAQALQHDAEGKARNANRIAANANQKVKVTEGKLTDAKGKLVATEALRQRAEATQRDAEGKARDAQLKLSGIETQFRSASADLQKKETNIQDVWVFSEAESQRLQHNYPQALDIINQVIHKNPRNTFALYSRGWTHDLMGNYQAAEADFREATKLEPKYARAYNGLGIALID